MGEILSHSEVEAILSALDFSSSPQASPAPIAGANPPDDVALYDFEHPLPLRSSQLDHLRLASASTCHALQSGLANRLHTAVVVNFLGVEQSTFREYLATAEQPGCLAVFESPGVAGCWLLDLSRSLAFTMIDCLLGGCPTANGPAVTRPFTEVESHLINRSLTSMLPELAGGLLPMESLRMTRVISDGGLIAEATSNEAVALVSLEVICGPCHGLMQLCVPWGQVAQTSRPGPVASKESREAMRHSAIKVPVIATARIARLSLSTRELAGLQPGDILLTDVLSSAEVSLEVDGREIFRGTPGQRHNRKVVCLSARIASERAR